MNSRGLWIYSVERLNEFHCRLCIACDIRDSAGGLEKNKSEQTYFFNRLSEHAPEMHSIGQLTVWGSFLLLQVS
mgnify:CR=1 FL=1